MTLQPQVNEQIKCIQEQELEMRIEMGVKICNTETVHIL
jgi:hypothetical protein